MSDKFEKIAVNPFDNLIVGANKRYQFAEDNIKSMTANNPSNLFDPLISDTQTRLDAYKGNTSESKISEALRIAYTSEIKSVMEHIITNAGKCEGLVKSVFGKNSPEYLMFLPFGLSEFHDANPTSMLSILDRMINLCINYKQQLGSDYYIDVFNAGKQSLTNAISNQKDSGSKVKSSKEIKEILWNELKKQLYKNMLTIALHYIDNLNMVLSYFNFTHLRHRHHKDDDNTQAYLLTIAAQSSKLADISYSPDDTLLIINNGNKSIFYYSAPAPDAPQPAVLHEIAAGDEAEVTALSLGAPANKFLIIVNKDATEEAIVEIALI